MDQQEPLQRDLQRLVEAAAAAQNPNHQTSSEEDFLQQQDLHHPISETAVEASHEWRGNENRSDKNIPDNLKCSSRPNSRVMVSRRVTITLLSLLLLLVPPATAFLDPQPNYQQNKKPNYALIHQRTSSSTRKSSAPTRLYQSAYRHPFDDNNGSGQDSKPFYASRKDGTSNSTTTTTATSAMSPEVRDWTNVMSNKEGIWNTNSNDTRGGRRRGSSSSKNRNNATLGTATSASVSTSTSTFAFSVTATAETAEANGGKTPSSVSSSKSSVLTEYDESKIQEFWDDLSLTIQYLPQRRHFDIYNALRVAYECHHGQMRKSGEPFIVHPVQVALLLTSLKMDTETIMAGLLHDTVEDTDLTFDQVEELFGPVVKSIVEGETKVSKLPKLAFCPTTEEGQDLSFSNMNPAADTAAENSNNYDEQAENLRQMFVAMTEDYRIIIVKLADRLHNMRTLQHMKPAKQIKISRETLDIFAPLAHRMGIWQFKSELEDISFRYLYPQEYNRLNRKLLTHEKRYREVLKKSQSLLNEQLNQDPTLRDQAAKVEVVGRTKEIYSLWHKMETKGERNLDNIGDVVALRVIITPQSEQDDEVNMYANDGDDDINVDEECDEEEEDWEDDEEDDHDFKSERSLSRATTRRNNRKQQREERRHNANHADRGVWLCYHVLGLVQHLPGFQPVPTRVKDYISFPKPNGYQSLHTAVMLQGQTIEVQIRTSTMNGVAEYGMASHWAYTDNKRIPGVDVYNTPWLSSIKEWQKDRISSRDFVESVRKELLGKRVFVFLRNGKILNLARGATAIDAAFQIHTEIGLEMHGVEINGKPVPFSYELRNGDVVSILSGKGKPSVDWMRYAKSRSTRSKLRSYFRQKQKESLREAGKILLMDYLWMHGPIIEQHRPYVSVPTTVEDIAEVFEERQIEREAIENSVPQFDNIDEMLVALGKQRDRNMLHSVVARLFRVPTQALVQAEQSKNRGLRVPGTVVDAVKQSRRNAKYAAKAEHDSVDSNLETPFGRTKQPEMKYQQAESVPSMLGSLYESIQGQMEHADPENLCRHCLPVYGDQIVGTKPSSSQLSSKIGNSMEAITMVHRIGCPVAQRALNLASASMSNSSSVDSVSPRRMANKHDSQTLSSAILSNDVPVKLEWSDYDKDEEEPCVFITEVAIVAEDRKLLLADCSEIVSEMSEIVKTGSSSSQEHATLVFLVQIDGLHQLQRLMDRLQQIRSVMSVERRFGSELLD